jgi:multidrug resistance efflux pump
MLELIVCSMLTVLPDYLFRHYVQGKRIGHEITLFSVWYELRIGITACLMLTVTLITIVFYYHPSTTHVSSFFRTVTILSESGGRVDEVFVRNGQSVKAGEPIFSLDDSTQQAAVETATRRIEEVDATFSLAEAQVEAARGQVGQAEGALEQAIDEYEVQKRLLDQGSPAANPREVEKLAVAVDTREGGVEAAMASLHAAEAQLETVLPAQQRSAQAALDEAEAKLAKTIVYAGTDGIVQQFALQEGDIVNPVLRPAGILVPPAFGHENFEAGFNQLAAQVVKPGMVAELTCATLPFKFIPMRVVAVAPFIPAGQFRPSDRLVDVQERAQPGTLTVLLEPIYPGSTDPIPPGSKCIVNAYTDNHHRLETEEMGIGKRVFLHTVDTVGLVHAFLLRIQALLLPVQSLVLTGH